MGILVYVDIEVCCTEIGTVACGYDYEQFFFFFR